MTATVTLAHSALACAVLAFCGIGLVTFAEGIVWAVRQAWAWHRRAIARVRRLSIPRPPSGFGPSHVRVMPMQLVGTRPTRRLTFDEARNHIRDEATS